MPKKKTPKHHVLPGQQKLSQFFVAAKPKPKPKQSLASTPLRTKKPSAPQSVPAAPLDSHSSVLQEIPSTTGNIRRANANADDDADKSPTSNKRPRMLPSSTATGTGHGTGSENLTAEILFQCRPLPRPRAVTPEQEVPGQEAQTASPPQITTDLLDYFSIEVKTTPSKGNEDPSKVNEETLENGVSPQAADTAADTELLPEADAIFLNDADADAENILRILCPADDILEMNPSKICERILEEEVEPTSCRIIDRLINAGYVRNPSGEFGSLIVQPYRIKMAGTMAILYSVLQRQADRTYKVLKCGLSREWATRETYYNKDPHWKDRKNISFEQIFNLDLLEEDIHTFMEAEYRGMMDRIIANDIYPAPIRKLFHMYANRGGEQLGFKKSIVHQLTEVGTQLRFDVKVIAEFLMFDESVYNSRNDAVDSAVDLMYPLVMDALQLDPQETNIATPICFFLHLALH